MLLEVFALVQCKLQVLYTHTHTETFLKIHQTLEVTVS